MHPQRVLKLEAILLPWAMLARYGFDLADLLVFVVGDVPLVEENSPFGEVVESAEDGFEHGEGVDAGVLRAGDLPWRRAPTLRWLHLVGPPRPLLRTPRT